LQKALNDNSVKYFFIISLVLVLLSCNNAGNNNDDTKKVTSSRFIYRFADTVLEQKITDTLMKLPFIEKSNSYIDSFSNHQHGIAFMSDTAGNKISVMAGYNGPERFETYYHFNIDPNTFEIRILDDLSGDFISIDEYIKKN
jgi:hypothetical protein